MNDLAFPFPLLHDLVSTSGFGFMRDEQAKAVQLMELGHLTLLEVQRVRPDLERMQLWFRPRQDCYPQSFTLQFLTLQGAVVQPYEIQYDRRAMPKFILDAAHRVLPNFADPALKILTRAFPPDPGAVLGDPNQFLIDLASPWQQVRQVLDGPGQWERWQSIMETLQMERNTEPVGAARGAMRL